MVILKLIMFLGAIGMSVGPGIGHAKTNLDDRISQCLKVSGEKYNIHPYLLWAIAKQESGFNPKAIGVNKDKTEDIGVMQINQWWLPKLKEHGIARSDLYDPCINIDVGAWILAQEIQRHGMSWRAVGAYNARTPWKQDVYAKKIQANLKLAYRLASTNPPRTLAGLGVHQNETQQVEQARVERKERVLRVVSE